MGDSKNFLLQVDKMIKKALLKYLFLFCLIHSSLFAARIDTFYGTLEVEEPVLLELIGSPAFQRLKSIHQYGVAYYTTDREEYTRYEHSLGVFAILRMKNATIKEQIAGLLHDVSHTVFSHVGDWIFHKECQEKDYQNSIHSLFLEKYGLGDILRKYDVSIDEILPLEQLFPMLEQRGPNLCADRIDYNIQGAYLRGFITYDEAMKIVADLRFCNGNWVSTNPVLMAKMARFSLFMTQNCWGSPVNYLSSYWLAEAILEAIDLGYISYEDIHFGVDDTIWDILISRENPIIRELMNMVVSTDSYYSLITAAEADNAAIIVKSKFRGIDPWIIVEGKETRLSFYDPIFCEEYQRVQEKMAEGWHIKLLEVVSSPL